MPSTYTGLGTQLMATGEKAGTWGTLTNTNLNILEQIAGGYVSIALNTTGATTLAVSDGAATDANQVGHRILNFTAALAGNVTVTIPLDVETFYIIKNSTTEAYSVEFKYVTGSGSSVTWASGDRGTKIIYATADDATNPNIVDATSAFVTADSTTTLTNKTLTAPKIVDGGFIADGGGDENLVFGEVSTPVNELKITNAATGSGPILSAVSTSATDANIPINITPKGTGDVFINPPSTGSLIVSGTSTQAGKIVLQADTDDTGSFVASFQPGVLTESTPYILPLADAGTSGDALTSNASGTLSWTTISGGASWQTVITADPANAVAGNGYFCDTSSAAFTVTLPTSATIGDEISFIDYGGDFDTNNLTVGRNSHNIQGAAADLTVAVERAGFTLVYVDATEGWLLKDK